QARPGDPGCRDQPPPEVEEGRFEAGSERRRGGRWGPAWGGTRAGQNGSAVVHGPRARAGGDQGDLEATQAPGQRTATRRGQQLDLGAGVEGVGGQRAGQPERLGGGGGGGGGVVPGG